MKKQIAVMMAAATAVTTVAPVLAHADTTTHSDVSASEINSKIRKALDERYKDKRQDGINKNNADNVKDYLNSRYAVILSLGDKANEYAGLNVTGSSLENQLDKYDLKEFDSSLYKNLVLEDKLNNNYVVTKADSIVDLLEKEAVKKNALKVFIVDKGIKDGSSVEKMAEKHYVLDNVNSFDGDTEVRLSTLAEGLYGAAIDKGSNKATYVDDLKITAEINGKSKSQTVVNDKERQTNDIFDDDNNIKSGVEITKVELTLTGDDAKKLTFEQNDKVIDLEKAYDKDNKKIDLNKNNTQNTLDSIVKFGFEENDGDNDKVTVDVKTGDIDVYSLSDVSTENIDLGKIYTDKNGYTEKGADFVKALSNALKENTNRRTFNWDGFNYAVAVDGKVLPNKTSEVNILKATFSDDELFDNAEIDKVGNNYELTFKVNVLDNNDKDREKVLMFTIKGDSQEDLSQVLEDLQNRRDVVAGQFSRLIGVNRYETAIKVSEEQFDANEADSVVIVGGEAQMDGLAAAPLASAKNSPILLANPKNGLDKATLDEIDRACDDLNKKTVYIVGGEKSVPKSVEKQLEDKFGAVVVRVSGADRYATSLQVARRLKYDDNINDQSKIYFVGGEGGADAMSISSVAAKKMNGKVDPILVVNENGIVKDTRDFIGDLYGVKYEGKLKYPEKVVITVGNASGTDDTPLLKYKDLLSKTDSVSAQDEIKKINKEIKENIINANPDLNLNNDNIKIDAENDKIKIESSNNEYTIMISDVLTKNKNKGVTYEEDQTANLTFDSTKTVSKPTNKVLVEGALTAITAGDKANVKAAVIDANKNANNDDKKVKLDENSDIKIDDKGNAIIKVDGYKYELTGLVSKTEEATDGADAKGTKTVEVNAPKEAVYVSDIAALKEDDLKNIKNAILDNNKDLKADMLTVEQGNSGNQVKITYDKATAQFNKILLNKNATAALDKENNPTINDNNDSVGYLIGGPNVMGTQVLKDAKSVVGTVDRISGEDRYDTNIKVIKEFYSKNDDNIKAEGIIFASGDNKYLVDAQTSGSFAAANDYPIMLAGNKITDDQDDILDDGILSGLKSNIYQVGGVVSANFMTKVVDILGL